MRPLLRCLALLLIAACSGTGTGGSTDRATAPIAPTSHDSAGITIDEYPADILARAPLVGFDTVPMMRAGADVDSIDLGPSGDVAVLHDGSLVAVDRSRTQILVFGPDGGLARMLGGPGEGPGEFRQIDRLFSVPGDTIVAADVNRRVALFTPAEGFARTFTVPAVQQFPTVHALSGRADATHWFFAPVTTAGNGPAEMADASMTPVSIGLVSDTAGVAGRWDTVGTVMPIRLVVATMHFGGQERQVSTVARFSAISGAAAMGDGGIVVWQGDHWTLQVYGAEGLERLIRAPLARIGVTPAMVDSSITNQMASLRASRPDLPDSIFTQGEATLREQPVADSLPLVGRVYGSPSDLFWVAEAVWPGTTDTLRATAVSPTRGVVGRLIMPIHGTPVAFGSDRIIVREIDPETGLVALVAYRLTMP